MQEVWAVTLMAEQGNRIPEFTWSQVSDSTSSQCLFRIKCFLSSLSRNKRIRSRSERLSRSLQAEGYVCTFVSVLFVLLYSSSVVQRFWNYIRQPLRVSAPLHFSDLPLSLSLPFPLSLFLDLVKGQDVFLLFTGRFAVPTLWALYKEGSNKISRTKVREVQTVSMGVKQHVLFSV